MKYIIAADCDGCACVVGEPGKSLTYSLDYGFARSQATREADAAARALFDCGANEVLVWDNHGAGANLDYHLLDARCKVALGSGFTRRWPELDDSFAGVLMVGYHSMEGTEGGVLAHTFSSQVYRSISLNGQEVGEIALDASVAGEIGVPVIFVASDDHGCAEAGRFLPWAQTVVTKQGKGCNRAVSKHPEAACGDIYEGVRQAVSRVGEMKTFTFAPPLEMEIRFKRISQACIARIRRRGWRMAGPYSIRRKLALMQEWS